MNIWPFRKKKVVVSESDIQEKRFDEFINFYYRQIINLPEPLLDVLKDLMKDYEEKTNECESPILSNTYLINPVVGQASWVSFTHNDILWWRKEFKFKEEGSIKEIEAIENEFNILYLYILERYDPELRKKYPEVEEFYQEILDYVGKNLKHL